MYFLCCMKSSEFSFVYVKYIKRILMMAALKAVSFVFILLCAIKAESLWYIDHLNPPRLQGILEWVYDDWTRRNHKILVKVHMFVREALVRVAFCQQFCNFYGQIMDITLTLTYQHHTAGQVPLFSVVGFLRGGRVMKGSPGKDHIHVLWGIETNFRCLKVCFKVLLLVCFIDLF